MDKLNVKIVQHCQLGMTVIFEGEMTMTERERVMQTLKKLKTPDDIFCIFTPNGIVTTILNHGPIIMRW